MLFRDKSVISFSLLVFKICFITNVANLAVEQLLQDLHLFVAVELQLLCYPEKRNREDIFSSQVFMSSVPFTESASSSDCIVIFLAEFPGRLLAVQVGARVNLAIWPQFC